MSPHITINVRVWYSPRADTPYHWQWAVDNTDNPRECLEWGCEQNEADAKREATEACASWIEILTKILP